MKTEDRCQDWGFLSSVFCLLTSSDYCNSHVSIEMDQSLMYYITGDRGHFQKIDFLFDF